MHNSSDFGYEPVTYPITRAEIVNTLNAITLFRDWLSEQNPYETFTYGSNADCLVARYLKAHGCSNVKVGGYDVDANGFVNIPLPPQLGFAAKGGKNNSDIISYGESLKALDIACRERPYGL